DAPIRVHLGVLDSEAYGVKSSSADMIRFVEGNMNLIRLDPKLKQAIVDTHVGYFKTGEMTQDLIWEQYAYPQALETILAGNSPKMIFEANPVVKLNPPLRPQQSVLINKTGSTNGFGAYAAFVPAKNMGIVILANKSYPIEPRVTAAYQILTAVADQTGSKH
ncbi:MAG: serine hydrolase, partial [Pyrinomonadaceae bacterium]